MQFFKKTSIKKSKISHVHIPHKGYPAPGRGNQKFRLAPFLFTKGKKCELINIPGLFIQGCSFQNLEKDSEWSKEGLAILKQYNARVSVDR